MLPTTRIAEEIPRRNKNISTNQSLNPVSGVATTDLRPIIVTANIAQNQALADRYATALYDLANNQWLLDVVADNFRSMQAMLAESADLRRFIASPVISREDHVKAMRVLATQAEFCPLVINFLGVVAHHRRLSAVGDMAAAYLARLAHARGQVTADVTSAYALSDAEISALNAALSDSYGQTVSVQASVDPALLGGLVVRVGSRMIDSSLRNKVQRLKLSMKGVG